MEGDKELEFETNWDEKVETFEEMDLKEDLLKGIWNFGFEKPSGIQQRAIMPIISGRDTIAQAQSGTGKTATFAIGALQRITIDPADRRPLPQALIIAPTRELAEQSYDVVKRLGAKMNVKCHASIGGVSVHDEMEDLQRNGAHVVIGTPGRIHHMIETGNIRTEKIQILIIDEADEMLSSNFTEQIVNIFRALNNDVQIVLVSATMPMEVLQLTTEFMRDPIRILVKNDEITLEGIKQYKIDVENDSWKFDTLCDLFKVVSVQQSVIFVNSRNKAQDLCEHLGKEGFTVGFIHGMLEQRERDRIMRDFKGAKVRVLVSTDLLGRGIDVQNVTLVVNYDIPKKREEYLHRIGRSGRFGRKGVAINLVTPADAGILQDIQEFYSTSIVDLPANPSEIF